MNNNRNILTGLLLLCLVGTWVFYFYNKSITNQRVPVSLAQPEMVSDQRTKVHVAATDSSLFTLPADSSKHIIITDSLMHVTNDSLIRAVNDIIILIDSLEFKKNQLKKLINYH